MTADDTRHAIAGLIARLTVDDMKVAIVQALMPGTHALNTRRLTTLITGTDIGTGDMWAATMTGKAVPSITWFTVPGRKPLHVHAAASLSVGDVAFVFVESSEWPETFVFAYDADRNWYYLVDSWTGPINAMFTPDALPRSIVRHAD